MARRHCKGVNEEFTQCVIFDGNTKDANIIGVEYILSEPMFEGLPEDELKRWHPHNYEILSGQLTLPGVPSVAEKAALKKLKKKMNSYGKVWHIWDTGHLKHPAAHNLPVGQPLLAGSYNRDGETPAALLEAPDKRTGISTAEKRKERADLAAIANPQRGVDDLKSRFPNATGAPEGVRAKQPDATP